MRIGFSSIYSWRPHVEHLQFLARLAGRSGHEVFYLTCDADLPTCYGREMRPGRSAWIHCARCRVGGVRSYAERNVSSIGELVFEDDSSSVDAYNWAVSSASTLGRFESDAEFEGTDFQVFAARLEPVARLAYLAAKRWIEREKLDAICVFNGRMDATRGILEAARAAGIRCITVERTWFGDGLHLIPDENCLGLNEVNRLVAAWRDKPLTKNQALRAANHTALRYLRRNNKEWRAYNTTAPATPWPITGARRRILLTPGSRNEVWGHPDWATRWSERTAAFDAIIDRLNLQPEDIVLRCHPNWGEKIGSKFGESSEIYYATWAKARGIHTVPSKDVTSTLGLIEQADAIVVCGGSAALEAGIIGKQVIATAPSTYQFAGFESTVYSPDQLSTLALHVDQDEFSRQLTETRISRFALRFCYTMAYRVAQYVDFVRCVITTEYRYLDGAIPKRFDDLIRSGKLVADDLEFDSTESAEEEVLALVKSRSWSSLARDVESRSNRPSRPVQRRWIYRAIDGIRSAFPRGDL